jgi:hypothetical protein
MYMSICDKARFAAIFFRALWKPTDSMTAEIILLDGEYKLLIDDGTDDEESKTNVMYG